MIIPSCRLSKACLGELFSGGWPCWSECIWDAMTSTPAQDINSVKQPAYWITVPWTHKDTAQQPLLISNLLYQVRKGPVTNLSHTLSFKQSLSSILWSQSWLHPHFLCQTWEIHRGEDMLQKFSAKQHHKKEIRIRNDTNQDIADAKRSLKSSTWSYDKKM